MQLGIISNAIPWLSDGTMAQITCIIINLWAGFAYFMLLAMGTMTAIPQDMYEADTGYYHKTLCFAIERSEN